MFVNTFHNDRPVDFQNIFKAIYIRLMNAILLTGSKEYNGLEVSKLCGVHSQVPEGSCHLRQLPDVVRCLGGLVGVSEGVGVGRGREKGACGQG